MNEISKTSIRLKLEKSVEKEKILLKDVAKIFDIDSATVSWIRNAEYWDRVSDGIWERILVWVNSGQGLLEYAQKRGKTIGPKKEIPQGELIIIKKRPDPRDNIIKSVETIPATPGAQDKLLGLGEDRYKYSVNLAEIGWIYGYLHSGKSIEAISKDLKIYPEIIKIIAENSKNGAAVEPVPENDVINELRKHNGPLYPAPHHEKTIIDLEINITVNGNKVSL